MMPGKRALFTGCLAHFIHDGFTDMLYIFFPIWQSTWGLSFGQTGLLKTLLSGSMALFQISSGLIAGRIGTIKILMAGTLLTSLAVLAMGWATSPFILSVLLIMAGIGSSVQHPLSSSMIADSCSDIRVRRTSLSLFNFIGDIGKLVLPFAAALLVSSQGWQNALRWLAPGGFAVALILLVMWMHTGSDHIAGPKEVPKPAAGTLFLGWNGYQAFWALSAIGVIDGATRMAFLTFFPFLLHEKGADTPMVGLALTLVFAGGAAGKLVCGMLATKMGILRSVIITESLTSLIICGLVGLSLSSVFLLAPFAGVALNGTSSVLYGSVPELVPDDRRSQAFSIFYTAILGAGAAAPAVYGLFSDFLGVAATVTVIGILALATIPLTFFLRGRFAY